MKRVVLETLWSDPLSRPFHRLDLSQYNFNDHSSRLMDMDIIRGRLESRSYLSAHHCIVDFRMIFDDVYKLTSQTNELRVLARALEKKFIQLLENLPETEFEVLEPDHGAQGAEAVAAGPQPQLPTGTTKAEVEQIWTLSTQLKFCVHVFNEVIVEHRELAKVFAAPLIFTLRDSTVVKAPMDLRTVKRKMSSKVYITAEDIESDVRRIFTTCYKCCVERSSLIAKAQKLQHAFEIKFSKKPDESPERYKREETRNTGECPEAKRQPCNANRSTVACPPDAVTISVHAGDTVEAKVPWSADKGEVMIYERDIALSETSSGDSDTTSTSYDSDSSD
ncbi:bromodomain-containing protein 3-like [Babylonia areolata]|uniref:bromodomain-containing protein 3-like n=1 Tax=Babylonia areolata TaxID=304850 RepID=UPI003FD066C5